MPPDATDYTNIRNRITYYKRFHAFGMTLLKYWTGKDWIVAGHLPWDQLIPVKKDA